MCGWTGVISVAGKAPGTKGGQVAVNATGAVTVGAAARIDASGQDGGGVVAVGTTLARTKGGASVTPKLTAAKTKIEAGARIAADATVRGDGGRVTVLSTQSTEMAGAISAKGAGPGGNGGFAEVSGASGFSLTGTADLAAPAGRAGTLLIDPYDLVLSNSLPGGALPISLPAPVGGTSKLLSTAPPSGRGGTAWLDLAILNASTANVVLQAAHDLSVVYTAGQPNAINLGTNTLTLQAGNNLSIDRGMTVTAAAVTLASGYSFNTSKRPAPGSLTLGSTIGASASTTATMIQAANITLQGGKNGVSLTDSVIGSARTPAGTLDISASGGGVQQSPLGAIFAHTLTSSDNVVGASSFIATGNHIADLGSFATATGFTLKDGQALRVTGAVTDGASVALDTGGFGLTVAAGGSVVAPSVSLSGGGIVVAGGVAGSGSATLASGSTIDIPGSLSGGTVDLTAGGAITETGSLTRDAAERQRRHGVVHRRQPHCRSWIVRDGDGLHPEGRPGAEGDRGGDGRRSRLRWIPAASV